MERHSIWPVLCTSLWTTAVTLMVVASFQPGRLQLVMALWSLLIGMAAATIFCKAAINAALQREHLRIEELATLMAQEALKNNGEVRTFHR